MPPLKWPPAFARTTVAGCVVLLHLLIGWVFVSSPTRVEQSLERVSQWRDPLRAPDDQTEHLEPAQPSVLIPAPITIDVPHLPMVDHTEGASVDWNREAELGSQTVLDGLAAQKQRRSFGRPPSPPKPERQRSIFIEPKHKLGELDTDHRDENIVWLSENCYMTLDKRLDRDVGRPTIESTPKQWCIFPVGKSEARGDLFDGMKSRRRCAPDDEACIASFDLED